MIMTQGLKCHSLTGNDDTELREAMNKWLRENPHCELEKVDYFIGETKSLRKVFIAMILFRLIPVAEAIATNKKVE